MDRDALSQRISSEFGVRNILWTFVFLISSATISLVFHLNTAIEKIFFVLGLVISLFFIYVAAIIQESIIERLLKMYERNKNYDIK